MSKKGFGQIFAIATLGGLVAAGISYVLQYKSFHKELEEEFHHFEEEEPIKDTVVPDRKYVALNAKKDEFVVAAKETANVAMGMASSAKGLIKEVGSLLKDQASSLKSVALDSAESLKDKIENSKKTENNTVSGDCDKEMNTKEQISAITSNIVSDEAVNETLKANEETLNSEIPLQDFSLNPSTEITEQGEETVIPELKIKEEPPHNVYIKDAKLKAEESTVIDLSASKDE